jgi:hypothetical protein
VRENKIACTVKRVSTARGLLRLRLSRAGRVVANGERMARGSSTVVGLRGKVHAGLRYTLTATIPAGKRTRAKITNRIVAR